jgi:hypothetical protein
MLEDAGHQLQLQVRLFDKLNLWPFFSKTIMIEFLRTLAVVWAKNANLLANFLNHYIGPWLQFSKRIFEPIEKFAPTQDSAYAIVRAYACRKREFKKLPADVFINFSYVFRQKRTEVDFVNLFRI